MSGRIRTIKPELLDDEVAASLSDAAWRVWVSTWTLADDHGNLRFNPNFIASKVWQDTTRDAVGPITELIRTGRITPYVVRGQLYGHVNNWEKHQRIDNAGKPRVPAPSEDDGSGDFAEFLRESPRVSAVRGWTTTTTTDQRPPTVVLALNAPPAASPDVHPSDSRPSETRVKVKRGSRISSDWRPKPETVAAYRKDGIDAEACVAEFVDYWIAIPGSKGVKLDWEATFRNRMRQLIDAGRAPSCPTTPIAGYQKAQLVAPILPDWPEAESQPNQARKTLFETLLTGSDQ